MSNSSREKKKKESSKRQVHVSSSVPSIIATDGAYHGSGSASLKDGMVPFTEKSKFTREGWNGYYASSQSVMVEGTQQIDERYIKSLPMNIRQDIRQWIKDHSGILNKSQFAEQLVARISVNIKDNLFKSWEPFQASLNAEEKKLYSLTHPNYGLKQANNLINLSKAEGSTYVSTNVCLSGCNTHGLFD